MFLRDDSAIVLDFLPRGHAIGRGEPIAQVVGYKFFSLLEVVARPGIKLKYGDRVYIGEGPREQIDHIKKRITIAQLTTFARSELPFIVEKIVKENEARYVNFFNTARPVSTRLHQLELLPGIGRKHMWDIINERKKGTFKSFADLRERIKLLPDPASLIVRRIMKELENETERFRLFTIGPRRF
jgi:putative nucleotide binding protein